MALTRTAEETPSKLIWSANFCMNHTALAAKPVLRHLLPAPGPLGPTDLYIYYLGQTQVTSLSGVSG